MPEFEKYLWWQQGIIYQVYPRSYMDANGDGIGDIPGIRQKLPYLKWLGINAIWISPIYPSPMADFGYDISNYTDIHPQFGSLADFDALVTDAHSLGIRVILDFVPNHTSDQHPWFRESRSSRDNAKRDWYLWYKGGADGVPPNNWRSVFGGSAWEWDERTQEFYYHAFLKEQPDLNWRNPEVQEAMFNIMRFWLDRGVDGFRVDVIYHIIKDEQLRDNPPNPDYAPGKPTYDELSAIYSTDRPEVHNIIARMRKLVESYGERLLIGEVYLPTERLMAYYGPDADGAHMPYNFQLILLPWNARTIAAAVSAYEAALPKLGWPNWVLGNHDQPRVASRIGREQARVAAVLLLTLRGTPTMYYGDEIGMVNVPVPPNQVQDPFELREPGRGNGRDPERSPMQWSDLPNAGFTTGTPWLPVGADYPVSNVQAMQESLPSLLQLYRSLIELRKAHAALSIGTYEPLPADGQLIAYRRRWNEESFIIVLNLSEDEASIDLTRISNSILKLSLSTTAEGGNLSYTADGNLLLRANEGLILQEQCS